MLVHAFERRERDRLKADAQHGAAAFGRELEHAVVLRKFRGNAGLPLDAASLQRAHHLPFGRSGVPKKSASLIEMVRAPQFSIS